MSTLYESFAVSVGPDRVRFGDCPLASCQDSHPSSEIAVRATVETEDSRDASGDRPLRLTLFRKDFEEPNSAVVFGHSEECPSLATDAATLEPGQIRVAVCVAIVRDGHVLITRRASHMRTFPERWVFPGGHIDRGETFEEAGIREVKEETGLDVSNLRLVGLWESCYPTWLDQGKLKRQHIVLYYQADLDTHEAFPNFRSISLEEQVRSIEAATLTSHAKETDMAAWIPLNALQELNGDSDIQVYTSSGLKQRPFALLQPPNKESMVNESRKEGISQGTTFILKHSSWDL